jgi:hypothetical protein
MKIRRLSALALVLIVLAALLGQFALNGLKPELENWGIRLWDLLRYFTILTCGLVGTLMAFEAMGRPVGQNRHATATLSIIMVGVIYQLLLAPPEPLTGIDWWPDFGFHVAIPVLTAVWWIVWAPKDLVLKSLPIWLVWPTGYCLYALIRGAITGQYPYFFFDIGQFGAIQVAINIVGLVTVFAFTGLLLWAASRALRSA